MLAAIDSPPSPHEVLPLRPMSEPLATLFGRLCELTPLSAVAQRLLQMLNQRQTEVYDLVREIEQDPAVAHMVLRAVNSSFYGLRNKIGDLRTAITLLGFRELRRLSFTVLISQQFQRGLNPSSWNQEQLWQHSVAVGTVARMLAQQTGGADPDEAFLAGLLHDIGLMMEAQHLVRHVPAIKEELQQGMSLTSAEMKVLSFDHAHLGGYMASRSGFPARLVAAIDFHHAPLDCPHEEGELLYVVHVANFLTTEAGVGSIENRALPVPSDTILTRLRLSAHKLQEIATLLPETLATAADLALLARGN